MSTKEFNQYVSELFKHEGMSLIQEFFIAFARFECALKQSISFASGNEENVAPNWDKFTSEIRNIFKPEKNEELINAVNFIINDPPRIQMLQNNQILWRNRDFQANTPLTTKLGLHIRDIRNNLFHGGKFNSLYEKDVSRNYNLLKNSLIIINEWLLLNEDVRNNFMKRIE